MKYLASILAVLALVFVATNDANAQCFRNNVVAVNGFSQCVGGSCFVQQQVLVPQSTAFFTGGRSVAFINQPAFVNVGVPVVSPVVQQVNIRRGLFGNVRRVQVRNFAAVPAVNVITPGVNVAVGRRNVFVSGF